MRQGQQNRRGRGRNNNNNNNNRKSQNPLMRSFESSGPDVKIRGTPSHIAEKYITLARDALSSGDPVLAENYLQHAEHYNRIILSYREQMTQQGGDPMGNNGAARTHSLAGPDGEDGEDEDDGDEFGVNPPQGSLGDAPPQNFQPQPQRNFDNQNNQNRYEPRQPRHDNNRGDQQRFNNNRHDRGDGQRFDRNDNRGDRSDFRPERSERHDRNGNNNNNDNRYRDDRRPQQGNGNGGSGNDAQQGDGGFRRRDRFAGPNGGQNGVERDPANAGFPPAAQPPLPPVAAAERVAPQPPAAQPPIIDAPEQPPAFLRRPVRRPRREEPEAAPAPTPVATDDKE